MIHIDFLPKCLQPIKINNNELYLLDFAKDYELSYDKFLKVLKFVRKNGV